MYILDTNTLIYYFKGMGKVSDTLLQHRPRDIAIPSIVLYELEVGLAKSSNPDKRHNQLETFIKYVNIIPFGTQEEKEAATIRAILEAMGTPIGQLDVLIAGTAIAQQGILVTHNSKEFSRVKGLQLEDWF